MDTLNILIKISIWCWPYESKENNKKYGELWSKIRYLIRSVTKNSDKYDEKYMKIKFNSHGEIPSMIIIVRAVLNKNNKSSFHKFSWMNVFINYGCKHGHRS